MKIAILSDSHNNWDKLQKALKEATQKQADVAFFAGDLTRAKGVEVLEAFSGPVHLVVGNMDGQPHAIWQAAEETDNVIYHGEVCDIDRKGVRIFMNHYPRESEQKARTGEHDLCIHGHTHGYRHKKIGDTQLINPGPLTRRNSEQSWALFDTNTETVEEFIV